MMMTFSPSRPVVSGSPASGRNLFQQDLFASPERRSKFSTPLSYNTQITGTPTSSRSPSTRTPRNNRTTNTSNTPNTPNTPNTSTPTKSSKSSPQTPSRPSPPLSNTPSTKKHTPSSATKRKRQNTPTTDRFIPNRSRVDPQLANFLLTRSEENSEESATNYAREQYKTSVAAAIFDDSPSNSPTAISSSLSRSLSPSFSSPIESKVLSFSPSKKSTPRARARKQLFDQVCTTNQTVKQVRKVDKAPLRMLEAPDMVDDYYLNLLDWGKSNCLAVGLGKGAYIWNAATSSASLLTELPGEYDHVTSVKWSNDGSLLAIGTNSNTVQVWDVARQKMIRHERYHMSRISALSWNGTTLSSGGRDAMIVNHDLRTFNSTTTLSGHEQEVCGLQWSPDGRHLASGANDNKLMIWDAQYLSSNNSSSSSFPSFPSSSTPLYDLSLHTAAVKAIAWCPWERNLLASGGGTSDRCIRFWDVSSGKCLNSVDTKSQVCAIEWSKHSKELVSSHGFSQNQVSVWSYPTMRKIADLTGHTKRVLHLTQNPEGTTVVSAGGEMLRFWKIWEKPRPIVRGPETGGSSPLSQFHSYSVR